MKIRLTLESKEVYVMYLKFLEIWGVPVILNILKQREYRLERPPILA